MPYMPTREQIVRECRNIRSTWTREERIARSRELPIRVINTVELMPSISTELGRDLASWQYLSPAELRVQEREQRERSKRRHPEPEIEDDDEDVEIIVELFEPVTVAFG